MLLIAVAISLFIGAIWVAQDFFRYKTETGKIREQYLVGQRELAQREVARIIDYIEFRRQRTEQDMKSNLKERAHEAIAMVENIYSKYAKTHSEEEIKALIRESLRAIRFNDERGYFIIFDLEGNNILLPSTPSLEGTNLLELQDRKGQPLVKKAVQLIKSDGEGFLTWYRYKPGSSSELGEKKGFIKKIARFGWVIGAEEYVDNFTKTVQQETLDWINQVRYGIDGSIFVHNFQGITLAHAKSSEIGVNHWNYKDANGVPVVRQFIDIAKGEQGGFFEYVGAIRPDTGLPAPKIGYAQGVKDWQWMVGTGLYLDLINETLAEKKRALTARISHHILFGCGGLFLCFLAVIILSRYLSGLIIKIISFFTDFLEQSVTKARKIQAQDIVFAEFQCLVPAFNTMVDERIRTAKLLQQQQEQLSRSRKMESLGVLAWGVAHDLNNILSAMIGYPDLILNSLIKENPQRKYLVAIKDSGLEATDLVDDLLTLAKQGVAQRMVLDVNNLVLQYTKSTEYNRIKEEHPNIEIELQLDPDLMKIKGSQLHIQKVIMNLVHNAVEAQPEGGHILVSVTNRYVDHPLNGYQQIEEGEYVVLTVVDKGVGMATEELGHIFEPFFFKKKLGRGGSGLGMAVVWATVQNHEGFVDVKSREGQGTTFGLYFRATRENILEEIKPPSKTDIKGAGQAILVVDDVKEQRELTTAILTGLGYQTTAVDTGKAAATYLQAKSVDLVLLDMILADPEMDGLETYKEILKIAPGQKAVIASGYIENDRVKAALRLGAGKYVKKPFTIEKIGSAIKSVLNDEG